MKKSPMTNQMTNKKARTMMVRANVMFKDIILRSAELLRLGRVNMRVKRNAL